jgi:hypothetical protein
LWLRPRPLLMVAIVPALAPPAAADAHIRAGVVASDFRTALVRTPRVPASTLQARVYAADRALRLVVGPGHVVSVLAPSGAALLRIDARRLRSGHRTAVWHDPRLRGLPTGSAHRVWAVPLVIDGARTRIEGDIWRVRAPPAWPWLLAGLPFILATALLLKGPRRHLPVAGSLFAGLALVATLAIAIGFAASPSASAGRVLEGFDETVFAVACVLVWRGGARQRRTIAATTLGLVALVAGCLKLAVLTHGIVLSALPATAARASVVLALWSGATALICGGLLLADDLAHAGRR